MKIANCLLALVFWGAFLAHGQFFHQTQDRQNIYWNGFEEDSLGYAIRVSARFVQGTAIVETAGVFCALRDEDEQADFLRFNATRFYFNYSEIISSNRSVYLDPDRGVNQHDILILAYSWKRETFARTNIIFNADVTSGKTEVYIGFRDYLDTQPHYGWAHLRRASTNAGVAYVMVDWAVNPFPGQPIRAGEPPDLPPLSTTVDTSTDPANPTLRVSWPPGFPGVKLQTTGDLTPPVQWLDQELSAERLAVVALPPEGTLFFRLVWAGP
jgi:hypothetical protein